MKTAIAFILIALTITAGLAGDEEEKKKKALRQLHEDFHDARVLIDDKAYGDAEAALEAFLDHYSREENQKYLEEDVLESVLLDAELALMGTLARQKKMDNLNKLSTGKMGEEKTVRRHLMKAETHLWNRDRDAYIAELKAAVALDEASYLAQFKLGELYMGMRDEDKAITHLKKSLEANEDYSEALFLLGQIYLRKGDKQNTRKYWNAYLEAVPRKGSRFEYVNNTLLKMGGG